ncbi:rna drb0094 family [Diaporthe amygdali]|uniref:rna drb0094 family n=1 Tax=Phomopsis amygdali TaxID=1214568 RepID=UPI0022FE374A|nr:rna drb0094 family [Diaporthe amygdali]KAJ0120756.1 rna drb0094 family [Diaporthe amygdali]
MPLQCQGGFVSQSSSLQPREAEPNQHTEVAISPALERKLVTLRQITQIRRPCKLRVRRMEVVTIAGGWNAVFCKVTDDPFLDYDLGGRVYTGERALCTQVITQFVLYAPATAIDQCIGRNEHAPNYERKEGQMPFYDWSGECVHLRCLVRRTTQHGRRYSQQFEPRALGMAIGRRTALAETYGPYVMTCFPPEPKSSALPPTKLSRSTGAASKPFSRQAERYIGSPSLLCSASSLGAPPNPAPSLFHPSLDGILRKEEEAVKIQEVLKSLDEPKQLDRTESQRHSGEYRCGEARVAIGNTTEASDGEKAGTQIGATMAADDEREKGPMSLFGSIRKRLSTPADSSRKESANLTEAQTSFLPWPGRNIRTKPGINEGSSFLAYPTFDF